MRRFNSALAALSFGLWLAGPTFAAEVRLGVGRAPDISELNSFFASPPDGRGLPPGSGTASKGAIVYARRCAGCHGAQLQGDRDAGGDALIGGRGSLSGPAPIRTVESYWPYATTLFDYIKRAMPFDEPGVLSDVEVYGVVAFILSKAAILPPGKRIDARTLPRTRMPNRDGFDSAAPQRFQAGPP